MTGLDAIMLLKNLRKQQEEAQREEEQRQKYQREQKEALEEAEWESGASLDSSTQDEMETQAEDKEDEGTEIEVANKESVNTDDVRNEEEEETEINQSIYQAGAVSNPLYSSLTRRHGGGGGGGEGIMDGTEGTHMQTNGTSEASREDSVTSDESGTNQNTDVKVNPLPKPPRSLFQDRRPSGADDDNNDDVFEGAQSPSTVHGEGKSSQQPGQAESDVVFESDAENGDELAEATNSAYSESDDSDECQGFYEVNPEPTESSEYTEGDSVTEGESDTFTTNHTSQNEDLREEVKEVRRDEEYTDVVTKMRLERSFIIDSNNTEESPQNLASPETHRKHSVDSHPDSPNISPSDSPTLRRNLKSTGKDTNFSSNNEEILDVPGYRDSLTESEEKFEQLYKELSRQTTPSFNQGNDITDDQQSLSELGEKHNTSSVLPKENIGRKVDEVYTTVKKVLGNESQGNEEVVQADETDAPVTSTPDKAPVKKVNSIIKKKSPDSRSGSLKRVQFSIDVETITPSSTPDEATNTSINPLNQDPDTRKKKDAKGKESPLASPKDKRRDSLGSPRKTSQLSNVTSPSSPSKKATPASPTKKKPQQEGGKQNSTSPTKKKGLFSTIFSTNTGKKSETQPVKDGVTVKADTPTAPGLTNKETSGSQGSVNKDTQDTSASTLKRQSTVDLNAPLILSGKTHYVLRDMFVC